MDVGGLGKGGGKNDKKACHTCGKTGHYAKECWWSGKATGKGKGDKGTGKVGTGKGKEKSGKGKGGGKNPHADKECFYCHKKGHVASECRAKKAAEKGGAV